MLGSGTRSGPPPCAWSASSPAPVRPASTHRLISDSTSSTWLATGRISTTGSMRPVGRTTCSTICPAFSASYLPGRRRDEDHLRGDRLPLLELQRPVVERRRQPEAVFDQRLLARAVPLVHRAQLRNRLMALVHHQQRVGRQVVVQARRRLARARGRRGSGSSSRCPGSSRSPGSSPDQRSCAAAAAAPPRACRRRTARPDAAQILPDLVDRTDQALLRRHVMRARIDRVARDAASRIFPVSGSKRAMLSITSSNSSTRTASRSDSAGKMSMTSPRTR